MKKLLAILLLCVSASVFAQTKPAYLVSELTIKDRAGYMKEYAPKAVAMYTKFGGTFIVGGDKIEGVSNFDKSINRVIIARFDSFEKAQAMVNSPERKALAESRDKYASLRLYSVEGK